MGITTVTATDRSGNRATASVDWTVTSGDPFYVPPGYVPPDLVTVSSGGRAAVQAVLDAGGRVRIQGEVRCDGPLLVDEGAVIYVAAGARLLKNFAGSGAQRDAFIQNRRWGSSGPDGVTKVHDVLICGPGEISATSLSMTGNLISLFGNRVRLADFTTTLWNGGRHTVLAGDDCRAYRCDWTGGEGRTGNGGLRFQGGKRFRGIDLRCWSGDDVFQFVPAGAPADPNYGMAIEDSYYQDCVGGSSHAKIVVIGLQYGGTDGAPDGTITMPASSSVRRSGFINCNAPDGTAVTCRIQNISSAGVIEDCYIDGVSSVGRDTTTGGVEFLVNAWEDTGGISRLKIKNLVMLPFRQPFAIKRGGVDVLLEDCRISRGSKDTGSPVVEATGTRTRLLRCILDGKGSTAAVASVNAPDGGGGPNPTGVTFENCELLNIGGVGIQQSAGTGTVIKGTKFRGVGLSVRRIGGGTITYSGNDYGTLTPPAA